MSKHKSILFESVRDVSVSDLPCTPVEASLAKMAFQEIPITNVDITSTFWANLQKCCRETTIPAVIKVQKSLDHWPCLTWKEGHATKPHPFWDSDIYKIIEAACYFLIKHPDEAMMANVEEAVRMIRKAQYADGYISSYFTVHGIDMRWTNLRDMHELYCIGHLIEATVAYETLTGSGKLLEVAMNAIRHIDSIFGAEPGKKRGYPGHQEIEIGLLRLHEMTGDPLPLKLARYFIAIRGERDENDETYFDHEAKARGVDPYDHMGTEMKCHYQEPRDYGYHQADCLLVDAQEIKGHSVRAMYYYTAATDLIRIQANKEPELAAKISCALDRLWRDMVDKKMYVTGGIGSVTQWEGFGPAYRLGDLETEGCYAETCATFALINWCQRRLRLDLKGEYADVMEISLYNAFLGAISMEGDAFYYQNVLRTISGKPKERSKWFGVACCPPNVAKLLGSMGSLIYSFQPQKPMVAIHLYIESEIRVPGTDITISQKTNMPWSGEVDIKVSGTTALALRIPGWAAGSGYECSIAGEERDGYLYIASSTNAHIRLSLPLSARKVYANPRTDKNEICIMRGPLVYCFEDVDNSNVDVDNIALVDGQVQEAEKLSIAGVEQVVTIRTKAKQLENAVSGTSLYGGSPWRYGAQEAEVIAIPYFLRANRGGNGAMRVWTPRQSSS